MAALDRSAALLRAEKALRQGRIDAAIDEYLRIVEAQPRDWNSANALGDLYARSGRADLAAAQYTRIADHLAAEGFYPKAAAIFKKVLKVRPDDEYALLQSGEIAAKQGLLADARRHLQAVVAGRRAAGDRQGAAEIEIRIGTLDPDDLDARLGAAAAAREAGHIALALGEFREVARRLEGEGRAADALAAWQAAFDLDPADAGARARLHGGYLAAGDLDGARRVAATAVELKAVATALAEAGRTEDALDALAAAAALDPSDLETRADLGASLVARGDLVRAAEVLTPEVAAACPRVWLPLAELELCAGRMEEGRAAIAECLTLDRGRRGDAVALGARLAGTVPEAAYQALDAVADADIASGDFASAAAALGEFVGRIPSHVVALMRLVEIAVDGGLEPTLASAQAGLADAYLDGGRGLEARIISEDLLSREPSNAAHLDRFRRALVLSGEPDPDAVIAERLSGESPFMPQDALDLNEGFDLNEGVEPDDVADQGPAGPGDEIELDLEAAAAGPGPARPVPPEARSLTQVFQQIRDEVDREPDEEGAAEQYRLALTYRELGMVEDAMQALEAAARSPRLRFDASALLGRLYLERGEKGRAVEWLERAAEAPAPVPEAGHALLYDLADTLEMVGEQARALAVFVELESEAAGYRDVVRRIERLSRAQAKG
ncbi:MAG: tetratricopeptide repeat protein [Vicinamibacterales bacterium]